MVEKLIQSLTDILGSGFNDIACILVVVIALFWFIRYDVAVLIRLTDSLKLVNQSLSSVKTSEYKDLYRINQIFGPRVHPVLASIWTAYYCDLQVMVREEKSLDIKDYFNLGSILITPARRKKVESIPGMLITIGVLGTFIGVAAGMGNLDVTSAVAAQGSTGALFNIVAASLGVTVVSIVISILFQILDKSIYSKAVEQVQILQVQIGNKIPASNTLGYFEMMVREQQKQTSEVQKLVSDTSEQFGRLINTELISSMSRTFEDSIKQLVVPSILGMREIMEQMSELTLMNQSEVIQKIVDNFVDRLNSSLGEQFATLGSTIKESADSLEKARVNLDILTMDLIKNSSNQKEINEDSESIVKAIAGYQDQVLRSNESLAEALGKLNQFTGTLGGLADTSAEMLGKLAQEREKLQEENNLYYDHMNNQMVKVQEDLRENIDSIFSKYTYMAEETFGRIETAMNASVDGLTTNSREILDEMDSQTRNLGTSVRELTEEMDQLNSSLNSSIKEFNEQLHAGVTTTFQDFDQGLGEICTRLSGTMIQLRDALEDLPGVIGELKGRVAATRENEP